MPKSPMLTLLTLFAASAAFAAPAAAAVFRFDTDPFAGSTALTTPGRQVVGGELSIPVFNIATDRLSFDPSVFDLPGGVRFASDFGANLPAGGRNVIVLRDIDADGNSSNGILNNAGLSANLIASQVTTPGAGLFLYFNTGLNLNRLVYSTDLSSADADLRVIARFTGALGSDAQNALSSFSAANFDTAVPEPSSWAMLLAGFGLIGSVMRRRTIATVAA